MKKRYNNYTRSPVMRKGGGVPMRTGTAVSKTSLTISDIATFEKLPIGELMKLRTAVGQGAGTSDPGYQAISAMIKTKKSQGAKL